MPIKNKEFLKEQSWMIEFYKTISTVPVVVRILHSLLETSLNICKATTDDDVVSKNAFSNVSAIAQQGISFCDDVRQNIEKAPSRFTKTEKTYRQAVEHLHRYFIATRKSAKCQDAEGIRKAEQSLLTAGNLINRADQEFINSQR
jgi:hypothetical protein